MLLRSVGQYWSCCQFRRCSIKRVHFRKKLANGPTNGRVTRSMLHADFTTFWLELLLYIPRLTPCIGGALNLSFSPGRFLVITTMFLEDCRRLLASQVPDIADHLTVRNRTGIGQMIIIQAMPNLRMFDGNPSKSGGMLAQEALIAREDGFR